MNIEETELWADRESAEAEIDRLMNEQNKLASAARELLAELDETSGPPSPYHPAWAKLRQALQETER